MSQLSYNSEMAVAQIGQIADTRNRTIESWKALEAIPFGRGVCASNDPEKPGTCRLPRRTGGVLILSADLVASNVINGKVGGVAISPVTYASSHDNTMDLLVAAIEDVTGVNRVALADEDGDNRAILIEIIDADIVLADWAVTLGGSQATITASTSGATENFLGLATFDHTRVNSGTGGAQYGANDMVNVLSQGAAWVETVNTPDLNALPQSGYNAPLPALLIIGGTDKGKFAGFPAPGGAITRDVPGQFKQVIEGEADAASAVLLLNIPGGASLV